MFLSVTDASSHGSRRLIVQKSRVHFISQGGVMNDFLSLVFCVLSPDVRLVMGSCGIVASMDAIAMKLGGDGVWASP